jgi:hypothetical protein
MSSGDLDLSKSCLNISQSNLTAEQKNLKRKLERGHTVSSGLKVIEKSQA